MRRRLEQQNLLIKPKEDYTHLGLLQNELFPSMKIMNLITKYFGSRFNFILENKINTYQVTADIYKYGSNNVVISIKDQNNDEYIIKFFNDKETDDTFYSLDQFINKYNQINNLLTGFLLDIYNYGYVYNSDFEILFCYIITKKYNTYENIEIMNLNDRIEICNDIIEFYTELKNNNLIIRDFRKENIGVDEYNRIKIIDFEFDTIIDTNYYNNVPINGNHSHIEEIIDNIGYYYIPYYLFLFFDNYETYIYSDRMMLSILVYDIIYMKYNNINASQIYFRLFNEIFKNFKNSDLDLDLLKDKFNEFIEITRKNIIDFNTENYNENNVSKLNQIRSIFIDNSLPYENIDLYQNTQIYINDV